MYFFVLLLYAAVVAGTIFGSLFSCIDSLLYYVVYFSSPVAARSYVYNSNATPILYHIERCRDPDCDGSNRSALSDISSSVFKGHSVGSDIDDTPVIDYIKRSKLSSIAKIKTETKSDRSSIPISRFSLLSEDSSSTNKVARESVARVKVDHTVGTTGNPGIKPPVREIHKGRKVTPLDLRNTRVSHIPWSEKPKSSCAQKKLLTKFSRSSGNRNSDQSNDNIQVTRIRSVSLNTISRSTAAGDTSLSTFDDAIHLNDYDITKQNSFLVHKADSQLKHSFSESTSTQTNSSSQSDPTGVLSITSKLKFSISVRSHTRVEHLPRTIIQTDSRNSAPLFSGAQEKQRLNRVFVTRVPRKSLT